jgi:glycine cleavage system H lipoate-binding protein
MDFLPTKGIEYLLVIGYLMVLIPFWWVLQGSARRRRAPSGVPSRVGTPARSRLAMPGLRGWFRVPEGLRFHPGHTWAAAEAGGVFKVGLDDFAQRLIGPPDALRLPEVGATLEQGEKGWSVAADGREVNLLSPVRGEVVEVNPEVLRDPALLTEDPYGRGWLLKVQAPRPDSTRKNLMPWRVATAWMEDAAQRLSNVMSPQLGQVLQDGGVPVAGLARQIDPEHWDRLAAELLLTDEQ